MKTSKQEVEELLTKYAIGYKAGDAEAMKAVRGRMHEICETDVPEPKEEVSDG